MMVPLKCLINFCRTLEMPLINCEINLILTWSANCCIVSTNVACANIRIIATGRGDDYAAGCWFDYLYFQDNYKMIAIDLSK